jgi:hypothetical protein
MPAHSDILGFGNQWYAAAYTAAISVSQPSGNLIRVLVLPAPCFLATKFDAFKGRGNQDYLLSKDMEDIITILDGRPEIIDEIQQAEKELRSYLSDVFSELLKTDVLPTLCLATCLRIRPVNPDYRSLSTALIQYLT